jgi:CRISPR/Cas system CMR-associated protein Cmr1 (group 7 of RAMP superfamily)
MFLLLKNVRTELKNIFPLLLAFQICNGPLQLSCSVFVRHKVKGSAELIKKLRQHTSNRTDESYKSTKKGLYGLGNVSQIYVGLLADE